jgi:Co/Zn/Cd efflux system component
VALTGSAWPDVLVAAAMALLFLNSASQVIRQALGELRAGTGRPARGSASHHRSEGLPRAAHARPDLSARRECP